MSDVEEIVEYVSRINKDLSHVKRVLKESLDKLGLSDKALCEEHDGVLDCVLSIPLSTAKPYEPHKISTLIDSDKVYTSYIFINASYDTISRQTLIRIYSYDENNLYKKLVELIEKSFST